MNKKTENLQQISQLDADCILYTGKDFKHASKIDLIDTIDKIAGEKVAAINARAYAELQLSEARKDLAAARANSRREDFTEVPTEELNDVISDVRYVSENIRKIVLDRVDAAKKSDLLMDCFQAVERMHAFCIGRSNASLEVVREYK